MITQPLPNLRNWDIGSLQQFLLVVAPERCTVLQQDGDAKLSVQWNPVTRTPPERHKRRAGQLFQEPKVGFKDRPLMRIFRLLRGCPYNAASLHREVSAVRATKLLDYPNASDASRGQLLHDFVGSKSQDFIWSTWNTSVALRLVGCSESVTARPRLFRSHRQCRRWTHWRLNNAPAHALSAKSCKVARKSLWNTTKCEGKCCARIHYLLLV